MHRLQLGLNPWTLSLMTHVAPETFEPNRNNKNNNIIIIYYVFLLCNRQSPVEDTSCCIVWSVHTLNSVSIPLGALHLQLCTHLSRCVRARGRLNAFHLCIPSISQPHLQFPWQFHVECDTGNNFISLAKGNSKFFSISFLALPLKYGWVWGMKFNFVD